jgi:hypothetical protein
MRVISRETMNVGPLVQDCWLAVGPETNNREEVKELGDEFGVSHVSNLPDARLAGGRVNGIMKGRAAVSALVLSIDRGGWQQDVIAQVVRMSRAEALEARWCWLESREGVVFVFAERVLRASLEARSEGKL